MKFEIKRTPKMAIITGASDDGVIRLVCDITRVGEKSHALTVYRADNKARLASAWVEGGFDRTKRVAQGTMCGLMSSVGKRARQHANKAARAAAAEAKAKEENNENT